MNTIIYNNTFSRFRRVSRRRVFMPISYDCQI